MRDGLEVRRDERKRGQETKTDGRKMREKARRSRLLAQFSVLSKEPCRAAEERCPGMQLESIASA